MAVEPPYTIYLFKEDIADNPDKDMIEGIARAMTNSEYRSYNDKTWCDADIECEGFGYGIETGKKYKLWELRIIRAVAVVNYLRETGKLCAC